MTSVTVGDLQVTLLINMLGQWELHTRVVGLCWKGLTVVFFYLKCPFLRFQLAVVNCNLKISHRKF
jgi:hypothetical protein